jgi:predicted DNA-binding transcriptional regulator AlpA
MANAPKPEPTPAVIQPEDLLTVEQLCKRLQVRKSWVFERTRARGKVRDKHPLPVIYLSPKELRFSWRAISAWLVQNKD